MKDKGMPKADFVMGLILMACSLVIVVESLKIPRFEKDWGGFYAAPGFVPLILGITTFMTRPTFWGKSAPVSSIASRTLC